MSAGSVSSRFADTDDELPLPFRDQLTISPAVVDDLDRLAELEAEIFPSPWSRDALAAELAPSTGCAEAAARLMLVGRSTGETVGYALFHRVLDACELLRLAVSPSFRGRGFGASLLAVGLDEMASEGALACRLEVGAENTAAIHLYERFGFVREGRRKAYYRHGEDALLLVLEPIPTA